MLFYGLEAPFPEQWHGAFGRDVNRGVIIIRLILALPLLVVFAGCVSNEPREVHRAGGSYQEEIKSPLPRQMLIDPTCAVR